VSIEALLARGPGSLLLTSSAGDIGMAIETLYFVLLIDIHLLLTLSAGLEMSKGVRIWERDRNIYL
jgi:hypothetical protein